MSTILLELASRCYHQLRDASFSGWRWAGTDGSSHHRKQGQRTVPMPMTMYRTRTFFCHPPFSPKYPIFFPCSIWEVIKTWEAHAEETPPTWGFCSSGVGEGGWVEATWKKKGMCPESFKAKLWLQSFLSSNCNGFTRVWAFEKFDPMFVTAQMWQNLSLNPLPLKTRSSRFGFLGSLSSWREWSNLSYILKLWLMRRVCDRFKVRWDFKHKLTQSLQERSCEWHTEVDLYSVTYHDNAYLFP